MPTSIETIEADDLISASRTDINNNFDSLNTNKIETSVIDTDNTLAANSDSKIPSQKAVKAYVDSGGNVNASETTKGIVEEANDSEVTAGTATGATGAKLVVTPAKLATRLATLTSSITSSILTLWRSASNTLVHSNDTSRETPNATYAYIKMKECLISGDFASVRIKFTLANPYNAVVVYGKIYKNGVAIGTEQNAGVALSEDFTNIVAGDLIQIYAKTAGGGDGTQRAVLTNMRFYYDETITHIVIRELTTALPITEVDNNITNQDP